MSKSWKRTQKQTLELLGAKEIGEEKMDGIHPLFIVEVKHRKTMPKLITGMFAQAEGYAKKHHIDKPPLGIIKEKGKHTKNAIVFLRLGDFEDCLGNCEFDGLGIA